MKKLICLICLLVSTLSMTVTAVYSASQQQAIVETSISYTYVKSTNFTYSGTGGVTGHTPDPEETCIVIPTVDDHGNTVTQIDNWGIYNDPYVQVIEIPETVTKLGWLNFFGCQDLDAIILYAKNPITTWFSVLGLQLNDDVDIYVPDEAYDTYRNASGWIMYRDQIKKYSTYRP